MKQFSADLADYRDCDVLGPDSYLIARKPLKAMAFLRHPNCDRMMEDFRENAAGRERISKWSVLHRSFGKESKMWERFFDPEMLSIYCLSLLSGVMFFYVATREPHV